MEKGHRKYTLISRLVASPQRENRRLYAGFLIRKRQFITCRIQLNTKSSDHAFHRDKHGETCGLSFGITSIASDKHPLYARVWHKLRSTYNVVLFILCKRINIIVVGFSSFFPFRLFFFFFFRI